jgi:ferredoxin
MKISVDTAKCQGHTLCAMTAPELFDLDATDGHAIVTAPGGMVPPEHADEARRAFTTCPERAITVEE